MTPSGSGNEVVRRSRRRFGHADHLGVAAQVDVRSRRVERVAEPFLELAAGDQVLDVDLVADRCRPRAWSG